MRIAFVISTLEIGGAERYLEQLADGLRDRGIDPVIIGNLAGRDIDVPVAIGPKWSRRTLLSSALHARREAREYLQAIRQSKPDVIHFQFKREQILLTRRASKIAPVVWTEHGTWVPGLYGRALASLYRRAAKFADRIICVSEPVADSLAGPVRVDRSMLHVIDNPVDRRVFYPDELVRASTRMKYGVSSTTKLIVTTSRLEHAKGLDLLIEAMNVLPSDYSVIVAGLGTYEAELRKRAMYLGERVRFTGFVADVENLLRAADVFVLPSRAEAREGSPLSLLQAMATGLPQVATVDSGVGPIVGSVGTVMTGSAPHDIAAAIAAAYHEKEPLGKRGLLAAERFDIAPWLDKHEALLAADGSR